MNYHITDEQWAEYFSVRKATPERIMLFAQIKAHTQRCEMCRSIMEKASQLQAAAASRIQRQTVRESSDSEVQYLEVADKDERFPKRRGGVISLELVFEDEVLDFVPESLEQTGSARKYAFTFERSNMAEDRDPHMYARLSGRILLASFPSASVSFMTLDGQVLSPQNGEDGTLRYDVELPGVYTLQVRFN